MCGSVWYNPVSKWAHITSCPAVVISAAAPATTIAGTGSKQLTDEGEEHNSDGSMQDPWVRYVVLCSTFSS